jgi:hypothetical protein
MAAQPRFFIVRPSVKQVTADGEIYTELGALVPLVAVDELPEWLDISSASRDLSVEQTVGLCNLGIASKSKELYAVEIIHHVTLAALQQSVTAKNAETKPKKAGTAVARPSAAAYVSASNDTKATATPTAAPAAHSTKRMQAHQNEGHSSTSTSGIAASVHNLQQPAPPRTQPKRPAMTNNTPNNITNTTTTRPSSSASNTAITSTEYCRHWCRYGTCKFGLGCHYLHAMPTTAAELAAAGLRDIPAWWVATAAGVEGNPTSGARFLHPHQQHPRQQQQHQRQHLQHHHQQYQNNQQQQLRHLQHAQHTQQGRHHGNIHHHTHATHGHNHGLYSPTITADSMGSDGTLDPRDVRFAVARQLAPARHDNPNAHAHAHAHTHTHTGGINTNTDTGGGGSGATTTPIGRVRNNRATRAQQLRETVEMLRELGLGAGGGGGGANNGGGGGGYVKPRRREINPLQKVRGNGAVVNRGGSSRWAEVEADLLAASPSGASSGASSAPLSSSSSAAGARGQMQSGLVPVPGLVNVVEDGQKGGTMHQDVVAGEVEKLVDV